ncbi:SulP family inorganic anion transporter [Leucobacter allii]|uniref:SulP family inorganic anion transporter n=1 Tax=Leucobacter allii TaxID=2932247 RepID=UPI001FD0306C|nr:SulP family inorganic anion transporter [Leucobacter allii]UOR01169.1 SulP family inorganic anion transporter [Leucobacter allii]
MANSTRSIGVRDALRSPRRLSREVLAGIVTTLALVPEVISFSVVAGVDPMVSLVASVVLVLGMSFLGGRPGVITAAAGSVALVVAPMTSAHGTEYLLPAIVLAGLIQVVFGLTGLARLMRYVPRSVMLGFVNALGILIFLAQVPHVLHGGGIGLALFGATLAIVLLLPRLTKAVPAALVAIVVVTAITMIWQLQVPDVADEGRIGGGLPGLTELSVPLTAETLGIILPTAVSVALVGLMESLLTAKLVDEITETPSHKGRESWGLGVANILAAVYGGTGGCAMIGQTVLNVKTSGGRTRVSTFVAGVFLLGLITALSDVMGQIPMVALAAVMMVVAVTTVDWHSVRPRTLLRMPFPETLVMLVTIAVVVATENLAYGVIAGVLLAMVLFARRVAHVITVTRVVADPGGDPAGADGAAAAPTVRYTVHGPLFFGSSNDLVERFSYADDPPRVVIDLSAAQIWDASTVAALDSVEQLYARHGASVTIEGLDERSDRFHRRLTGELGA